jgi:outer membrane PBP1 activator LpoA protein
MQGKGFLSLDEQADLIREVGLADDPDFKAALLEAVIAAAERDPDIAFRVEGTPAFEKLPATQQRRISAVANLRRN